MCASQWSYSGPNPFSLPNSGDATELAYVEANLTPATDFYLFFKWTPSGSVTSWVANADYAAVLVKSSTLYRLYVNVHAGDLLLSPAVNKNGQRQAISHISKFKCAEGQN